MFVRAELIFTGSELLLGHILNTHAQYLGMKLAQMGIEVVLHTTAGDNRERLEQVLRQSWERSDLLITTGGLGPTTDDLTKEVFSEVLGLPMVLDENLLVKLKKMYCRRGLDMPKGMLKQACLPEGAKIIKNRRGTAPGVLIEKGNKIVIMLPGPPGELKVMFEESVVPFLLGKVQGKTFMRYKVLKLTGISESAVQEQVEELGGQGNPEIAYMVKPGEIQVRISARSGNIIEADKMVDELAEKVRKRVKDYIFGYDDEVMEEEVGKLLNDAGLSIGVAESCTGGLITARLTEIPGSSKYLKGGVVAYSNELKNKLLSVDCDILERYGAVSEQTATAMAEGIRKTVGSAIGLAVTGIAGPGGASPGKPRGLVYISLSDDKMTFYKKYCFPGDRAAVRHGAVNAALNMVKGYLTEEK
ncbi:MAG: Putative competence-damage inducible protein [Pelotomaculum thermopropionicum]|uniref:Putative competence-damage inducible protein n=1 Tax=Pelotomaculum thermopropionicum TaxID=110500 RepID=A0A101HV16_9FIRM|nr:MAG: Putative competence-damage inducible protein [Pelotomaculum thermopropionicum]